MKRPGRKFLIFGIVFLLMAGACAAPALPTPTLPPPTLAPTLAPPTLAPTPVPPTLEPTPVPTTLEPTPDLLVLILAFQDAFNIRDTAGLFALFIEDPSWSLGFGIFAGNGHVVAAGTTKAARNIVETEFEFKPQLKAGDCSMQTDQATCSLVITDDCKPPAIGAYHVRTQFTFKDGKISSVYGKWDSSEENAFNAYDSLRQAWAVQNLPDDSAAYNNDLEWDKFSGSGDLNQGHLTAIEFGQAVERMCTGFTAAGN